MKLPNFRVQKQFLRRYSGNITTKLIEWASLWGGKVTDLWLHMSSKPDEQKLSTGNYNVASLSDAMYWAEHCWWPIPAENCNSGGFSGTPERSYNSGVVEQGIWGLVLKLNFISNISMHPHLENLKLGNSQSSFAFLLILLVFQLLVWQILKHRKPLDNSWCNLALITWSRCQTYLHDEKGCGGVMVAAPASL